MLFSFSLVFRDQNPPAYLISKPKPKLVTKISFQKKLKSINEGITDRMDWKYGGKGFPFRGGIERGDIPLEREDYVEGRGGVFED